MTTINSLRTLRALCNPFNLCDLNTYLHSIKSVEKSFHEIMPESGFGHDAFLAIFAELDAIYVCAESKCDNIVTYWSKLKEMIPLFEIILEGDCSWEYEYEVYTEIEKILYS